MPGKSRPADTATIVSDDAIRQRAYYMWEADGRPEGRGEHYWHLAHEEATRGKNPSPEVKAGNKAAKAKVKVKVAEEASAKPKKPPKPRAAVRKAP